MRPGACFILAFTLGHIVTGEYSPIRLFLLRIFARYIEVPLLHLSYLACVGRLEFLSRFFLTRWLIVYPIAYPFGHWGNAGRPVPLDYLVEMVEGLEGKIAVCPFSARRLKDGVSEVLDCFGCGLCAAGCQTSASAIVRRKS